MRMRSQKRDALTLIEVLLVVAIMAILAGMAIPNANPSITEQLRSAASILTADLAYARSQAITYGSQFAVTFDTEAGQYEIEHVGTNTALDDVLENPFADPSTPDGQYVVVLSDLPSLGPQVRLAAIYTINASGEAQTSVSDVTFSSLGETSRSLDTRIWLSAGSDSTSHTISVRVNAVTGLATVEPPGAHALPERNVASPTEL